VVFYRPFPSVTGFCRKLPDLCLGIFGIVSQNFSELCLGIFQHVIFRIACMSLDKDYFFVFFGRLKIFLG
jgi:cellulose synthase/poly-beta-1,6-N-acetylglucosamine synthase-like glycosyltransferase